MNFRIAVLAAGKGTRMKQDIPKALTPVAGKPILQYLIESIHASGLDEQPIVVVGPEAPELCAGFGVPCEYVVQDKQLGTGHAVQMTREATGEADALIVLYGDHPFISTESLNQLADTHASSGTVITMMTTTVPDFEGWHAAYQSWGRILRDEDGEIVGIREFKDATEEEKGVKEVNPALLCFDAAWLWKNIDQLRNNNAQDEYYLTDLIALAFSQGERIASLSISPEEVIGINTQEDRERAEQLLKERYG